MTDDSSFSGRVEVITGPMFAGKTTELIHRLKGTNCVVLKHAIDTRFSTAFVSTHDDVVARTLPTITVPRLALVDASRFSNVDVIGIDEGQFFPDLVAYCAQWAAVEGKRVVVAGLDLDYRGKAFVQMAELATVADNVCKLQAKCHVCGDPAPFTQLIQQSTPQTGDTSGGDGRVLVGGSELYQPSCAQHFALSSCD